MIAQAGAAHERKRFWAVRVHDFLQFGRDLGRRLLP
jgi:hypothetical protein